MFNFLFVSINVSSELILAISDCREYAVIKIYFSLLAAFLTHVSTVLITIVTFAVYTMINDDNVAFSAGNVFTTLALFNQLTVPLFIFPICVPIICSAIISTKRISKFLEQSGEIQKDLEGVRNMARVLCRSDVSLDLFEDKRRDLARTNKNNSVTVDSGRRIINGLSEEDAVKQLEMYPTNQIIINDDDANNPAKSEAKEIRSDSCDKLDETAAAEPSSVMNNKSNNNQNKIKLKKQNQLSTSTKLGRNRLRTRSINSGNNSESNAHKAKGKPLTISDEYAVCIRDGQFAWSDNDKAENMLQIDCLSIPKGNKSICCEAFLVILWERPSDNLLYRFVYVPFRFRPLDRDCRQEWMW